MTIAILAGMVIVGLFYYAFFLIVLIMAALVFSKLYLAAKEEYDKDMENPRVREKKDSAYYRNKKSTPREKGAKEWWEKK